MEIKGISSDKKMVIISASVENERDVEMLLDIVDGLIHKHCEEEKESREILSSSLGTDGVRTNYEVLQEHIGGVTVTFFRDKGIWLTGA